MSESSQIYEGLHPIAEPSAVVTSIVAMGLPARVLAEIADVTLSTVDNWRNGNTKPRSEAATHIDDVRFVFHGLLVAGLQHKVGYRWFTARHYETPFIRPSEKIKDEPELVIDMLYKQFPVLKRVVIDTDVVAISINE